MVPPRLLEREEEEKMIVETVYDESDVPHYLFTPENTHTVKSLGVEDGKEKKRKVKLKRKEKRKKRDFNVVLKFIKKMILDILINKIFIK